MLHGDEPLERIPARMNRRWTAEADETNLRALDEFASPFRWAEVGALLAEHTRGLLLDADPPMR